MNCKNFLLKSKSPTSFTPYCYHWLPENQAELLPDHNFDFFEDLSAYYEKFDTLAHITTFENATEILKNGFKPQIISTNSVVNNKIKLLNMNEDEVQLTDRQHPINDKSVIWYGPMKFGNKKPFER